MLLAKRVLLVLMCILMVLGMTACGDAGKKATNDTTVKPAASQTSSETTAGKFDKRIKFSATSINLPENVDFMTDPLFLSDPRIPSTQTCSTQPPPKTLTCYPVSFWNNVLY